MDILDNAIIVRNLSDPSLWGSVLNQANWLIKMVDYMEEINDIEHKLHKSTHSLAYDNFIHTLESLSRQWSESLKSLHLGDLDWWLINDCSDIAQLDFRLKQVKCRVGGGWNKEIASKLHTDLLNITDRLVDVILNREDNAFICMYDLEALEEDARHDAWHIVSFLCKWLCDVMSIQDRMQKIIEEAEQILNPQPIPTETEPQRAVKPINNILNDEDIRAVFEIAIERQWITREGSCFRWNSTTHSLAYLVQQISNHFSLSQKYFDNGDGVNWSAFNGLFIIDTKRKKDLIPTGDDIRGFKNNWYRSARRNREDPFLPDGCKEIDDWLIEVF